MLRIIGLVAALVSLAVYPCLELRAQETTSTLEFRLADDNDTAGWKTMQLRGSDMPIYGGWSHGIGGGLTVASAIVAGFVLLITAAARDRVLRWRAALNSSGHAGQPDKDLPADHTP